MGIRQVDLDELDQQERGTEAEKPATKRERERKEQGEKNLNGRLQACFDRIAESLEQRGDVELATIVREDAQVMAGGVGALTRAVKAAFRLVVLFLCHIEPPRVDPRGFARQAWRV